MKLQLRNGEIKKYEGAQVMGIINVTPDSFYAGSRSSTEEELRHRVREIVEEGGTFVDVGAYSSRPDGEDIPAEEEMSRLAFALPIIKDELAKAGDLLVSVDTFRADIARLCVEEFGVDIINDISGGQLDQAMFDTVGELHVPYIMMHMRGTPQTMQTMTDYPDGVTNEVIGFFRERIALATEKQPEAQLILDPGFGFAKTTEQNYQLFGNLTAIKRAFPENPLMVGISRKSMIYKLLETDPEHSLNGTSVLNALAVAQGADILRVHDVKEAVDVVKTLRADN